MRRASLVAACTTAAGVVLAVACGFPDPEFVDDARIAPDGAILPAEGGQTSSTGTGDGGASPDGNTCVDGKLCDCDGDGYNSRAAGCGGGGDCDDHNPFAYPDQGYSADARGPRAATGTATGTIEPLYKPNVKCLDILDGGPGVSGANATTICDSAKGFIGTPNCGEAGVYNECMRNGTTDNYNCTVRFSETRTQACK